MRHHAIQSGLGVLELGLGSYLGKIRQETIDYLEILLDSRDTLLIHRRVHRRRTDIRSEKAATGDGESRLQEECGQKKEFAMGSTLSGTTYFEEKLA